MQVPPDDFALLMFQTRELLSLDNFLRLVDGPPHTLVFGGQHHVGPEGLEELPRTTCQPTRFVKRGPLVPSSRGDKFHVGPAFPEQGLEHAGQSAEVHNPVIHRDGRLEATM